MNRNEVMLLIIYPAIDILGGKVVRLTQGDYQQVATYYEDPLEAAAAFKNTGAEYLHLVDLDAAKTGENINFSIIHRIAQEAGLFVQTGGGVRDEAVIDRLLSAGVNRVIIGTAAVENFEWAAQMMQKYGEGIAIGVDARKGKAAIRGWYETSEWDSLDLCVKLEQAGMRTLIYTDISRDGTGQGANATVYQELRNTLTYRCNIIASGGVGALQHLEELKQTGVDGAIVGRALYTGQIKLEEALALC